MPRVLRLALAAWFAVAAGSLPAQADLGPIIARYGNWEVHRYIDKMTDKVQCIATYRGRTNVQLTNYNLMIKTVGTPRSFRYRLNDEPASGMITTSELARGIGTIEIAGALFDRLVHAARLRVQVLTYRFVQKYELREFDLDLNGIYSAYGAVYHCR